MKRCFLFLVLVLFTALLFAEDFCSRVNLWPTKELDKIEVINCTRFDNLHGILVCGKQSVGFTLKSTGDKYTCYVGDWKRDSFSYCLLFDVSDSFECFIHFDDDDCYLSILESSSVKTAADFFVNSPK